MLTLRIYKATRGVTTIPGGALAEGYLVEVRTVRKAPAASSGSTSGMRRERRRVRYAHLVRRAPSDLRRSCAPHTASISSRTLLIWRCADLPHCSASPEGVRVSSRSPALNPFDAAVAILMVITAGGVLTRLISTVGKVLIDRRPSRELPGESSQVGSGESERTRDAIDDLSDRVERLEAERDFYKELLDSPGARREIRPPERSGD